MNQIETLRPADLKAEELPDGSGFFTMTIGDRPKGFLNRLKYHRRGCARGWLLFYRNATSAYSLSRSPRLKQKPMTTLECLQYAWMVHPWKEKD